MTKSRSHGTKGEKLPPKLLINVMQCPKCGTIYHWGIEGYGNCPHCRKILVDTKE